MACQEYNNKIDNNCPSGRYNQNRKNECKKRRQTALRRRWRKGREDVVLIQAKAENRW